MALVTGGEGCTNILVSRGASADGSTQVSYNADDTNLFGVLGHWPAADHAPGAMREIWDWDDGVYLGSIPEPPHTYNVVGNVNEFGKLVLARHDCRHCAHVQRPHVAFRLLPPGVVIAETTFGGLKEVDGHGTGAIMDYGSLIWTTLQRARTAREAISTMDGLVQEHGYASDGESFAIADGEEVWLLEMVSKGQHRRGAVWVAIRVPDGLIGSTANQARYP